MLTYKDDYLMHYGIKGQKKGRRRFQNPDGSLTAAGRLRYLDPSSGRSSGSFIKVQGGSNRAKDIIGLTSGAKKGESIVGSSKSVKNASMAAVNTVVMSAAQSSKKSSSNLTNTGATETKKKVSEKESYQVLPSKENGTVTFTHKSKDGSFTSWYYNSKNGGVVKEIVGKDGKVVSRKTLSAKDPEYTAYTNKGKRALGATNSQKSLDNLRLESASKAKQKLTPEKVSKVKKDLEKQLAKKVTKPNAKRNRRDEIQ